MIDGIYITEDDAEIIDYLTDAGVKHNSDDTHRIFTFFYNGSYHLVLFLATPGDKGFAMFKIDDIRNNLQKLITLKVILQHFLATGDNVEIIEDAIDQVELVQMAGLSAEIFKHGHYKS